MVLRQNPLPLPSSFLDDDRDNETLVRNAMMADQRDAFFLLERLLAPVTYKPGVTISARPPVPGPAGMFGVGSIFIEARVPSSYNPMQLIPVGKSVDVPDYLIERAESIEGQERFYNWLFNHLMSFEKHEAQEWFKINGTPFNDPHK